MNEIVKKFGVMQVNSLKQYDNLLTKENVGFRAYLLEDEEIYPEKSLYIVKYNESTLTYGFEYAVDSNLKDLGSTATNGYWYAGYHKYAKTLYDNLDTIIKSLSAEEDCTIIAGLKSAQTYKNIDFPSGMLKAVVTPSSTIADIEWVSLKSDFVWETGHVNDSYLTTPIVDSLEDVEKITGNIDKLFYLNQSETRFKSWYEVKETSNNVFEWVIVSDSGHEPVVKIEEDKLGLTDGVQGSVYRHGNDIHFHFHYKALGTPINEIALTMPKPFAGSIPEFVATTTTLDAAPAIVCTIDEDGKLAFRDDTLVGDFTVDGAYYSRDFLEAKGYSIDNYAEILPYAEHTMATGVTGSVTHFGNLVSFTFRADSATPIVTIAEGLPLPMTDVMNEFVATNMAINPSSASAVVLDQSGKLSFKDGIGYGGFTVNGFYYSKNYEDFMGLDISMEKGIKQLTVLPEPTEFREYQQIHYIGETDDNYKNNTLYICTRIPSEVAGDPDTFEWKEIVGGQSIEVEDVSDSEHDKWLVGDWEGFRLYQYKYQGVPEFPSNNGFYWLKDKYEWSSNGDFRVYGFENPVSGPTYQCFVSGDLGALTEDEIKQLIENGYAFAQSQGLDTHFNKSVDFYSSNALTLNTHTTTPGWVHAVYNITSTSEEDKWEIVNYTVSDIESNMALGTTYPVSSFTPGTAITTSEHAALLDNILNNANKFNKIAIVNYSGTDINSDIKLYRPKSWYEVTKNSSNEYYWEKVVETGGAEGIQVVEVPIPEITGRTGGVYRVGNEVKFSFSYNGEDYLETFATNMPSGHGDKHFVFNATTEKNGTGFSVPVELYNKTLRFVAGQSFNSFTVEGSYYTDEYPINVVPIVDPISAVDVDITLPTGITGKVYRYGNFVHFDLVGALSEKAKNIVNGLPKPIDKSSPMFVATVSSANPSVSAPVELTNDGVLRFKSTDGEKAYTVSGWYITSEFPDWMTVTIERDGIQHVVDMPEANAANEHRQVHYIGESTSEFNKDTIYICVKNPNYKEYHGIYIANADNTLTELIQGETSYYIKEYLSGYCNYSSTVYWNREWNEEEFDEFIDGLTSSKTLTYPVNWARFYIRGNLKGATYKGNPIPYEEYNFFRIDEDGSRYFATYTTPPDYTVWGQYMRSQACDPILLQIHLLESTGAGSVYPYELSEVIYGNPEKPYVDLWTEVGGEPYVWKPIKGEGGGADEESLEITAGTGYTIVEQHCTTLGDRVFIDVIVKPTNNTITSKKVLTGLPMPSSARKFVAQSSPTDMPTNIPITLGTDGSISTDAVYKEIGINITYNTL